MNDDLRIKIWNKFKGECQDCGKKLFPYITTIQPWEVSEISPGELEKRKLLLKPNVHHLDENKNNGDETNLILLCNICHMGIHHLGHRDHDYHKAFEKVSS